jgi:DNA repair protein RAD57
MDLFTQSLSELSKRCRLSPSEIRTIIDLICTHLAPVPRTLEDVLDKGGGEQKFTAGDEILDRALGGGIRTGMVWEFVGERLV